MIKLLVYPYLPDIKHGYGDENEYRLVRDLLTRYEKRIRPSANHNQTMNVTFSVALAQIIDVVRSFNTEPQSDHGRDVWHDVSAENWCGKIT